MNDSNRDRFVKKASYRTNEVLKRLKVLGNCSNRNLYEYSEEDVEKIFAEIDKRVKEVKAKFKYSMPNRKDKGFQL